MNRISSAISEIHSQYPELETDEVTGCVLDLVEENLINFIAEVELPDPLPLKLEWHKEKRKSKGIRALEKLREKEELIKVLHNLQQMANGYKTDATSLFEPNGKVYRDVMQLPSKREINPSDIERRREAINNRTDVWGASFEKIDSDRFAPYRGHIDELIDTIFDEANMISRNKVEKVTHGYDAEFGNIIRVRLKQNAREALESWLKLLDKIDTKDLGINIRVDWTGGDNLSDDELVDYMVEIMLKSGVGPKVSEDFDSVKAVREGWE